MPLVSAARLSAWFYLRANYYTRLSGEIWGQSNLYQRAKAYGLAATEFQRTVCRIIAANRIASGESYVAGGTALNEALKASRLSQDIDIFHDELQSLATSYTMDIAALEAAGYECDLIVNRLSFIECRVRNGSDAVILEWLQDSAFRFFPLQEHTDFGLALHPFDLATNKVLALVGRLEVRDWIDVISCETSLQPLGYLAWAASGKDPGLSPLFILEQAHRSGRYTQIEIDSLSFAGPRPDATELARKWKRMLVEAQRVVELLPAETVGSCVVDNEGELVKATPSSLLALLRGSTVKYHSGKLRGSYPVIAPQR